IINTNTASSSGNYFENIINGISSGVKQFITSFSEAVSGNTLTTTINGVVATTSVITGNIASSSENIFQNIINGVASNGANIINSLVQNTSGNTITTTVNGVIATTTIINSNSVSYSSTTNTLTSNVNGLVSTTTILAGASGNYLPLTGGTVTGNINMSASIIPTASSTYTLGSLAYPWMDVFIGAHSLYVNGQKVLQTSDDQDVVVSANINQNLVSQTSGTGNIELNPVGAGQILLKNNVILSASKTIRSSDLSPIYFSDGTRSGNVSLSGNLITTTNTNGPLELASNGTGNVYVTNGNFGIGTTAPVEKLSVAGNILATGTILGLNLSGTNTGDNAINTLYSGLAASKQDLLTSGTNIKTINGNSILGSGDLALSSSQWTSSSTSIYYNTGNVG
ncbi:MAG: hypothetical protein KBD12_01835, partial [Candidatus Pacebacteria bacterium]|nr:hypothetical protein [Candidatus Paceibacterota bacterium]